MNGKVWTKGHELMLLVNPIGTKLIRAMSGERSLTAVIDHAYKEKAATLQDVNLADAAEFDLVSAFSDRSIQSAAFIMALWSRGLIHFEAEADLVTVSAVAKKIAADVKPITVQHVVDALSQTHQAEFLDVLSAFNKEQPLIMADLLNGAMRPVFYGQMEETDERLADTVNPTYQVAYVKPALSETLENAYENIVKRSPTAIIVGAGVVITAASEIVGDSCGQHGSPF